MTPPDGLPPGAQHAPATARNRDPILHVVREVLPARGLVLEIASGTGEHAAHFAPALPGVTWQPSDGNPAHLVSIRAWRQRVGAANLAEPLHLDVETQPWPLERADAVVCINMIHIAPWTATLALMSGTARVLPRGGVLFLYGPFKREGGHTADSNQRFDDRLRGENPAWGVRDLGDVQDAARAVGLTPDRELTMPANNLSVVFRRT